MTYLPLEDYGLLGNLETAALVGRDGSIDWLPLPHVESPSVLARIVDDERGGHFAVRPAASSESIQAYVDRTNVLETRFRTASGAVTVADFMPTPEVAANGGPTNQALYRRVVCEEGTVDLDVEFEPRFDYARTVPTVESSEHGVVATGDHESGDARDGADDALFLSSSFPLDVEDAAAGTTTTLSAGEEGWLVLGYEHEVPLAPADHERILGDVVDYWRAWAHDCSEEGGTANEVATAEVGSADETGSVGEMGSVGETGTEDETAMVEGDSPAARDCPIAGPGHDLAVRSSLVLKLLTHADTGAICAAPTTSLPEQIGGVRNWDYRYNWIRDAAFTVRALSELGHVEEAADYFDLCLAHCGRGPPAEIQPVYGLHGGDDLTEEILDHLEGYRGSAPVRVGNAAADQHQLDVYGELVNGVYASARYGNEVDEEDWGVLRDVVDYVCEAWREPDVGIWEVRADRRHFVYSKVMAWVALDRGIRFVEEAGFDGPVDRWREERAAIREAVLEEGYSETAGSFVRSFGEEDVLDATGLLIPLVGFLPVDDERVQSTIDATLARLTTDDGLVYRYEGDDGLPGEEGTFTICSFWLVSALARSGRIEEASSVFEDVVSHASPLGLLAEEVDPRTGEMRGNYPQAFSHIGLINAVISLARARGDVDAASDAPGLDDLGAYPAGTGPRGERLDGTTVPSTGPPAPSRPDDPR